MFLWFFPFSFKSKVESLIPMHKESTIIQSSTVWTKCEFGSFLNTQICSKRTIDKAQSIVLYVTHAISELFTCKIFFFGTRHSYVKKKQCFFVIAQSIFLQLLKTVQNKRASLG